MADVLATAARKVVIDHHVSQTTWGRGLQRHAGRSHRPAGARSDRRAGRAGHAEMAALFAAIATDTGWFRFSSVTAATFRPSPNWCGRARIRENLYAALREKQLGPAEVAWPDPPTHEDRGGRLLNSAVTLADFAETGAVTTDTEDIVNRLLTVAGAEVAVLFLEHDGRHQDQLAEPRQGRRATGGRAIRRRRPHGRGRRRYEGTLAEAQTAVLDAVRKVLG